MTAGERGSDDRRIAWRDIDRIRRRITAEGGGRGRDCTRRRVSRDHSPLYAFAGSTPTGGEQLLVHLETRAGLWWAILALSVLTALLFVPVAFALHSALPRADRTLALLGAPFLGLFAVLVLAVTWANHAALLTLSADYASTSDGSQQTALVAAAGYANATLPFSLAVFSIVVPSIGILLLVHRHAPREIRGGHRHRGHRDGRARDPCDARLFVVSPLGSAIIVTSLLTIAWLALAGVQLLRRSSATAG